uniref:Uncharacterized protein n=1 Tax=viral metagenome TaxID=1070528 RepID=A0A6H2A0F4_9ZZZZ
MISDEEIKARIEARIAKLKHNKDPYAPLLLEILKGDLERMSASKPPHIIAKSHLKEAEMLISLPRSIRKSPVDD